MDKELYELCKEVYKRFPEWDDTRVDLWHTIKGGIEPLYINDENKADKFFAPLYTSDYLLEKLPYSRRKEVGKHGKLIYDYYYLSVTVGHSTGSFLAGYMKLRPQYREHTWFISSGASDTPLKALLKLAIALHDAGELPLTKDKEDK